MKPQRPNHVTRSVVGGCKLQGPECTAAEPPGGAGTLPLVLRPMERKMLAGGIIGSKLGYRLAPAVLAGAAFLHSAAPAAHAATFEIGCLSYEWVGWERRAIIKLRNFDPPIQDNARITVTLCYLSGRCVTLTGRASTPKPNSRFPAFGDPVFVPDEGESHKLQPNMQVEPRCTATMWLPAGPMQPFDRSKTVRTRPPPGPGLLEDSPGFSRQGPSGVGTPGVGAPKPSGPPPPVFRDSIVR
jgi:hypothetical protein